MAIHSQFPTFVALIRLVLRLLPLVAVGLVVVVLGTGCFLAAKGVDTMPVEQDAIAFAPSMAVGCAVAAAVALALGGKRKLAGAIVLGERPRDDRCGGDDLRTFLYRVPFASEPDGRMVFLAAAQ